MANQPVPGCTRGWLGHSDSMGTDGTDLDSCKGPHPCGGAVLLQQPGQFQCVCLCPNKCKPFSQNRFSLTYITKPSSMQKEKELLQKFDEEFSQQQICCIFSTQTSI